MKTETPPSQMPNNLEAFWMPFTANKQFKANPRLLVSASGMYYTSVEGNRILDGAAGLWCVNAGHSRPEITEAVRHQLEKLDYAPCFQMGHPVVFEFASKLTTITPGDLNHVFFTNSGSEAVDSALKIALAYQRAKGQGTRQRLIGRERGYHGVGFGGISVGGMVNNRKTFGSLLTGVDHLSHTHDLSKNAFSKGEPKNGWELANELERIVALHDASNIAAVIVEPVAGSTGVLVPPKGYLKRLREICDKHGILLIFDEVITGFGRLGTAFAAQYFDVMPDMITTAKGITNGAFPMGAVFVKQSIYDTMLQASDGNSIELFHGYTYSGHPSACAAGIATLDVYKKGKIFENAKSLSSYWQEAAHSLKGLPPIIDIRNIGIVAGIELESLPGKPGKRGFQTFLDCYAKGLLVRASGDTIALSPPLILEKQHIDTIFNILSEVLKKIA